MPPKLVVLLSPDTSENEDLASLKSTLAELAEQDGFRFETRNDLLEMDLDSDVWLVVVVSPDPGVLNLASANPEVQFLGVGIPNLQASQNVSVLGSGGDRPDQQGFLAGYLAAVVTQDWRVGAITSLEAAEGRASHNGFKNGVIFYCGLCRPAYPPFYQYPAFAELAATANEADQQTAAELMVSNGVKTVYVSPDVENQTLLELLANVDMKIIGGKAPSKELKDHWVASIRVDDIAAIKQIWPRLVNGEQGIRLVTPLVLTDQNIINFSTGRQRLVEKLLADMLLGFIDTGVDPISGELR
jgi:hypothetical protein